MDKIYTDTIKKPETHLSIYGLLGEPEVIIPNGRNTMIVKETINNDNRRNFGFIVCKNDDKIIISNNIDRKNEYCGKEGSYPKDKCDGKDINHVIDINKIFELYNKPNGNFSDDIMKTLNETRTDFIEFNRDELSRYNEENVMYDKVPLSDKKDGDLDGLELFACKKKLYDVSTTFLTENIFQNQETIISFQFLVNEVFNSVLDKYKEINVINKTDIVFLFKGGTTMKILFNQYSKYLNSEDNYYKEFFKRSDSDYGIFINPELFDAEIHRKNIFKLSFIILNELREIFLKCNNIFFDFDNNPYKLKSLIQKYNDEINSTKEKPCSDMFKDMKVVGVLFKDHLVFEDESIKHDFFSEKEEKNNIDRIFNDKIDVFSYNKKIKDIINNNSKRQDFYLKTGKLYYATNTEYYTNDGKSIYLSMNDDITKDVGLNNPFARLFSLFRLKYNFILFYKRNNKYGYLNSPAELIDVSINQLTDSDLFEMYQNINDHIIQLTYNNISYLKFNYLSFSINGYIYDFTNSLFRENFPWKDPKYTKKIKRLSYFILINLLLNKETVENNIKFLEDLIEIFKITDKSQCSACLLKMTDLQKDKEEPIKYLLEYGFKIFFDTKHWNHTEFIKPESQKKYNEFKKIFIEELEINIKIIKNVKHINLVTSVTQMGGYYDKYLKYKNKYLQLKNQLS